MAVTTVVLASAGVSAAYAAWSINGLGAAGAKAGTAVALTATTSTPSGASTDLLYPGLSNHLSVTITNPNPFSVRVASISLATQTAPTSVVSPANVSCTTLTALVTTSAVSLTGLSIPIAANASATYVTTTSPVAMGLGSDDGCQGAAFTFPNATVTGASG